MRRHETLQPLSRDHHQTLKLARQLQRAGCDAETRAALEAHRPELLTHFAAEEALCEQALVRCPDDATLAKQVGRMHREHRKIMELVERLLKDPYPEASACHALGEWLIAHVRFEERGLFNRLQDGCLKGEEISQ
ncbi:MAG TPA: hemerythrin domain-containing protein [Guyparkeria sp.]|nr:hemerythrin domain-containing protein [Guyparkeria sp.]